MIFNGTEVFNSEETEIPTPTGDKIGISLPTSSLQTWNQVGANLKAQLNAANYEVDLQYANQEIFIQQNQIEIMINSGCKLLIIAAIDVTSLSNVLQLAKEENIPVIAFDRLILNSDAVSYYVTFDHYRSGTLIGQYIEEKLNLQNSYDPCNIEFFAYPHNNLLYCYQGARDVLQPYIDNGQLVVQSGKIDYYDVLCNGSEQAQYRMDDILTAYYNSGQPLHACCAIPDCVSLGVTNALIGKGYGDGDFPIITGFDADSSNVKNILRGKQSMTIFNDYRNVAAKAVEMVVAHMNGLEPEVNDTTTYDNGVGVVPSYLVDPTVVDINNFYEVLIDSGYYTEDQLLG